MNSDLDAFHELCYYTLAHTDPAFIHQHVVDAIAAQTCTADDKPIKLTFALVGLYLHLEKNRTGKQVQLAHMKLARRKQAWPTFPLPAFRGAITVHDVLAVDPGPARDAMIHRWCASAWDAFRDSRPVIVAHLSALE